MSGVRLGMVLPRKEISAEDMIALLHELMLFSRPDSVPAARHGSSGGSDVHRYYGNTPI